MYIPTAKEYQKIPKKKVVPKKAKIKSIIKGSKRVFNVEKRNE